MAFLPPDLRIDESEQEHDDVGAEEHEQDEVTQAQEGSGNDDNDDSDKTSDEEA